MDQENGPSFSLSLWSQRPGQRGGDGTEPTPPTPPPHASPDCLLLACGVRSVSELHSSHKL